MNQQNNNTIIRPSVNNLVELDINNNAANEPTIYHQNQSRNASSRRYTKEESLLLISLFGEFYQESIDNERVLSPRRVQLDYDSWKSITKRYNDETNSQRSAKALKEKLELLKTHYFNKKDSINKTGRGGGPFNDCDLELDKILRDDPQTQPPVTFDSGTGEIKVHKRREEEVESIDEQQDQERHMNKKKKTRGSGIKRRVEAEKKASTEAEQLMTSLRATTEGTLKRLEELKREPHVVRIEDSEERKKRMDDMKNMLEKIYDKLKDA
jgi:hypothetical protein